MVKKWAAGCVNSSLPQEPTPGPYFWHSYNSPPVLQHSSNTGINHGTDICLHGIEEALPSRILVGRPRFFPYPVGGRQGGGEGAVLLRRGGQRFSEAAAAGEEVLLGRGASRPRRGDAGGAGVARKRKWSNLPTLLAVHPQRLSQNGDRVQAREGGSADGREERRVRRRGGDGQQVLHECDRHAGKGWLQENGRDCDRKCLPNEFFRQRI